MNSPETPTLIKSFCGHSDVINSVSFSPDESKICSSGDDNVMLLFDILSGECKRLSGHSSSIWRCDYSPTGKMISTGSSDRTIRLWYPESEEKESDVILGHLRNVNCVSFNCDGEILVSGSYDQSVKIWNVETKKCISTLKHTGMVGSGTVFGVDILSDSTTVLSGHWTGKCAKIWDLRIKECVHTFKEHCGFVNCVQFHPTINHIFASGSDDSSINMYDFRKPRLLHTFGKVGVNVRELCFHPSGKYLVSGSWGGSITIFELSSKERIFSLKEHTTDVGYNVKLNEGGDVETVQFSSSGKFFASSGRTMRVNLWKTNFYDGKEIQSKIDLDERLSFLVNGGEYICDNSFVLMVGNVNFSVFCKFLFRM